MFSLFDFGDFIKFSELGVPGAQLIPKPGRSILHATKPSHWIFDILLKGGEGVKSSFQILPIHSFKNLPIHGFYCWPSTAKAQARVVGMLLFKEARSLHAQGGEGGYAPAPTHSAPASNTTADQEEVRSAAEIDFALPG